MSGISCMHERVLTLLCSKYVWIFTRSRTPTSKLLSTCVACLNEVAYMNEFLLHSNATVAKVTYVSEFSLQRNISYAPPRTHLYVDAFWLRLRYCTYEPVWIWVSQSEWVTCLNQSVTHLNESRTWMSPLHIWGSHMCEWVRHTSEWVPNTNESITHLNESHMWMSPSHI